MIGGVGLIFAVYLTLYTIFMSFNETLDMYFIVMLAALTFPVYICWFAYCCKVGSKNEEERNWAILACFTFIALAICIMIWICYYFLNLYQYPEVREGFGGDTSNYRKTNKTTYLAI